MRLDRALRADLGSALRTWSVRLYLLLQLLAGLVFVGRRGEATVATVLLIWLGLLLMAFIAWWAGRHRLARSSPGPMPAARERTAFALIAVAGMTLWGTGLSVWVGFVLVTSGLGAWCWAAWRVGAPRGWRTTLSGDPRPFVPLLLLIGVPRLLAGGPAYLVGAGLALPSGVGQQWLYLLGLFAPMEAATQRPAAAAVASALLFGLVHVPLLVEPNGGDAVAAVANAILFQSGVGLAACLAYRRHRAVVPIGVAHALAIG